MVGLQGAGKTTNGAKLAGLMKKQNGKRPLLAACDVYRPAAIQQLEVVGRQLDLPVFQMGQADPVDIAKAAVEHAAKHGNDMVFLDTRMRLAMRSGWKTSIWSSFSPTPTNLMGLPVTAVDIAKAAVEHAAKHGNDMVFLDTAGRLHVDEALMEELLAPLVVLPAP